MSNLFRPVFSFEGNLSAQLSRISGINENLIPLSDEFVHKLNRFALYMAAREIELSDWLASLYSDLGKKLVEKSDLIMKAYMIGGTVLSALSLIAALVSSPLTLFTQSLLAGAVNGVGWNLVDSVGGIFATPKLFKEARESVLDSHIKTTLAWTSTVYFSTVLPALSLWGFSTLIQSVQTIGLKAVIVSGVGLGAAVALASSAFAFAGGMFVVAAIAGFDWYRAAQKSEPVMLLRDRLRQYDALQKKIDACSDERVDEKQKLTQKLARIKQQAEALAWYCNENNNDNDKLKVKLTDSDKDHPVFKEAIVASSEQHRSEQTKLAEYLIQKQRDKVKEKRFDTIANVIGGVGALLGGLALLIPPALIPLTIGAVVCFAISSMMKGYQMYGKYQLAKEKKKALEESKGDAALVRDYFGDTTVDGLSEYDTKRVAAMQCKARLFAAKNDAKQVTTPPIKPDTLSLCIQ